MRTAQINRKTKETDIALSLDLCGGDIAIDTGVPFFDHMLSQLAFHGGLGLSLSCKGDIAVDFHHTVEDCGLALSEALKEALGDKSGINRFGSATVPMDDALVLCALDISGRPFLGFDLPFLSEKIGNFDTELIIEFMRAFSQSAGITLHIKKLAGYNSHHLAEAAFKALARALREALRTTGTGVPSTKGVL